MILCGTVLSIIGYGVTMVESGGGFSDHCHNMTVVVRVFHGGRFLNHGMLTEKAKKAERMRLNVATQGPMRVDSSGAQFR